MALLNVDFYSDTLNRSAQMNVLLPDAPAPRQGFPTLFLLHGMTDDCSGWLRRSSIERYAEERRIAVVMPETRLGWYTNTASGERYFDFVADELPAIARRMLPKLSRQREDSFAAGMSMGGYGALKCALLRPEKFARAAVLSGSMDVAGRPQILNPPPDLPLWRQVFGPLEKIAGSENDLFRLAEECRAPRPEIWMWCGTEDFLRAANQRMRDHLRSLGFDLTYTESPGDHQWVYWDREIQNALDWMLAGREAQAWR